MFTRNRAAAVRLGVVLAAIGAAAWTQGGTKTSSPASKRMPDGKEWMTSNLNVVVANSYCYDDAQANCAKYGRLYTWTSAQQACRSLANAHGFYWTATESKTGHAWFYNFGGLKFVNRHEDGEKPRAFSVRCIRD